MMIVVLKNTEQTAQPTCQDQKNKDDFNRRPSTFDPHQKKMFPQTSDLMNAPQKK